MPEKNAKVQMAQLLKLTLQLEYPLAWSPEKANMLRLVWKEISFFCDYFEGKESLR